MDFTLTTERKRAGLKISLYAAVALLIPLLQTYTIYHFLNQNVDESEMVLYAVGFFGGDLDPHWYGYGTVGMYLLFVVYLCLGLLGWVFGQVESLQSYAWMVFDSGYFYQVGRYVFAAVLASSVMIYARLLERQKIPWPAIITFVLFCFITTDSLLYANYIRTDTMCALFVAIATYATLYSKQRVWLYVLAIACAGALAAKVNSVSMYGLLGVVSIFQWYRGNIGFRELPKLLGTAILAAFIFHPFGFLALPKTVYHMLNYVNTFDMATRETTHSLVARFQSLAAIFSKFMHPITLWSLLLLPFAAWRYRGLTLAVLLAQFFFVLPFVISPELRDYWFVPTYHAVRLLVFLSWWSLVLLIHERFAAKKTAKPIVALVALVLFAGLVFYPNVLRFKHKWQHGMNKTHTNVLAKAYLEDEILGQTPVYLDAHFNHVLPKVYHPLDLADAHKISRVFLYNRDQNAFLRRGFDQWLQQDYGQRVYGPLLQPAYRYLEQIRIDMYPAASDVFTLKVGLQKADGEVIDLSQHLAKTRQGTFTVADETITFTTGGPHPWLIFNLPQPHYSDGTARILIDLNGVSQPNGKVYFKVSGHPWGETYTHMFKLNIGPESIATPLVVAAKERAFVQRLNLKDFTQLENRQQVAGSVFVTSPAIYNRFVKRSLEGLSEKNAKQVKAFQDHYRYIFDHGEHIKTIRGGIGPPIHLFQIPKQQQEVPKL